MTNSTGKVITMLGLNLDSWNNLMVYSVLLAAAAAALGISTFAVVRLQKYEAAAAALEYDAYKQTVAAKVADAKADGIAAGRAAGNAILKAAQAELHAAESDLAAEKLRIELARIKTPLTERILNDSQKVDLDLMLRDSGLNILCISSYADNETASYANNLINELQNIGVCSGPIGMSGSMGPQATIPNGVNITGSDVEGKKTLENAFKRAGIEFGAEGNLGNGILTLTIGARVNLRN